MKLIPVTDDTIVNKLYKPARIQRECLSFMDSPHQVMQVLISPGEYVSGVKGAQISYSQAIKRLHLNCKARVLEGSLYLIKLEEPISQK